MSGIYCAPVFHFSFRFARFQVSKTTEHDKEKTPVHIQLNIEYRKHRLQIENSLLCILVRQKTAFTAYDGCFVVPFGTN